MKKIILILSVISAVLWAKDYKVKITEDLPYVDVEVYGKIVRIQRIQDTNNKLRNSYIRTSRMTPPFYIQPFEPVKGVETYGELELLDFIKNRLNYDEGALIDARIPKWFKMGTIPGAVNLPFSLFYAKEYKDDVLEYLGAQKKDGKWNFDKALTLVIFDNGPWDQQAVDEIKNLVKMGYPKEKIKYYRGGMQYWQILGLTTIKE